MPNRSTHQHATQVRQVKRLKRSVPRRFPPKARRAHLGSHTTVEPFSPPEHWYEPTGEHPGSDYRIVVHRPGEGYRHVVTPVAVRQRLEKVPQQFLEGLEVVQLSQMTRKKTSFPCYGMQWGSALYLYPLEESLEEVFYEPPRPAVVNEAKMYGGKWDRPSTGTWRLRWTEETIRDFYLNNILIHELGHLIDERNSGYADRERYAEWFAIEYGYRATGGANGRSKQQVRRRHHAL